MPAPVDPRIRLAIVKAYADGLGPYETIAKTFGVGRATVSRVLRLARETKSVQPKPHAGGRPAPIRGRDEARLEAVVRDNPCATLEELAELWFKRVKKRISRSSLHRSMQALGYSFKKKRVRAVEATTPEVLKKIRQFEAAMRRLNGHQLVFLDESGCQSNMSRTNSWSKIGSPAVVCESPYRKKNM